MAGCTACGKHMEASFRFCPWCGVAQRRKLVEFFRPHPNSLGRALRVSRYYGDDPQVRFSVWDDGVARAAVSLDEAETRRLASFLAQTADCPRELGSPRELGLATRLRDVAQRVSATRR